MAVVFALIVVAVIGAGVVIAVRAPGAGVLPGAESEGPVTTVPDGPLTAADLRAARFPIVFRGYRPAEVDALLERLELQLAQAGSPEDAGEPAGEAPAEAQPGPR